MNRIVFIAIVILGYSNSIFSQFRQTQSFSIADGLPSNLIYDAVEDKFGFLWFATDAGAVRFDGHQFQTFTTEHGLPDNEVLKVLNDDKNRIWINSFKQTVAYFDFAKNRFITEKEDKTLQKIKSKNHLIASYTMKGGVQFLNYDNTFFYENGKRTIFQRLDGNQTGVIVGQTDERNYLTVNRNLETAKVYLSVLKDNNYSESKQIDIYHINSWGASSFVRYNQLFLFNIESKNNKLDHLICLSNIKSNPISFDKFTINFTKKVNQYSITKNYIIVQYQTKELEIFDSKTKQSLQVMQTNFSSNAIYEDANGCLWICTNDKGIFKYEQNLIQPMKLPEVLSSNSFMSIAQDKNGKWLLGNLKSQLIEKNGNQTQVHILPDADSMRGWQRNIFFSQGKVFSFSEAGCFINFQTPILGLDRTYRMTAKTAIQLNDSLIIAGSQSTMYLINTITHKVTTLPNRKIRVTSIAVLNANTIYYGSTDGLHKYDLTKKQNIPIRSTNELLHERIMNLCIDKNQTLWVATASNGIYALQNDSILSHQTSNQGLISDNIRCVAIGKKNQLCIGTSEGVSLMNYEHSMQKPSFENYSTSDGLTSNRIQQILFIKDAFYLATDKGITILPATIIAAKYTLPVHLIDIKINDKPYGISSSYSLSNNQHSIQLNFAGIELQNHFKRFDYTLNNGKNWIAMDGSILNLQLEGGIHQLWIRAIDINGNTSTNPLKLKFDIEIPFYKTWWFWLFVAIAMLLILVYLNNYFAKKKQLEKINKLLQQQAFDEMEIEALKSQINPHFVFNCLNSIKGFIYEEDLENAEEYLDKFSEILRCTLNFSSQKSISLKEEVEYIDTYLMLEKLRFVNKFDYQINVQRNMNQHEIKLPAMLLQPFVENAIKHGVCHLQDGKGKIMIDVARSENYLLVTIDDNGIGRKKSESLKTNNVVSHESKGTKLTQRRIELYNIELQLIDKEIETGLTIKLKIPIPLNH